MIADEEFWQAILTEYSFVFSQVFSTPVIVFSGKRRMWAARILRV